MQPDTGYEGIHYISLKGCKFHLLPALFSRTFVDLKAFKKKKNGKSASS